MLRVKIYVTIIQKTQIAGQPPRDKMLKFDFAHSITCTDSWRDFTNQGSLTLPKNLYIKDGNNKPKSIYGTNINIGGFSNVSPLIMRGDRVIFDYGYRYFRNGKEIYEGTNDDKAGTHLFDGWISQVISKKPIEFKCEDNFWKLKQTPCPIHTFKPTDSLETIVKFLLRIYNTGKPLNEQFTFRPLTVTTFGEFRVGNETIAEVLGRLRKTYHFESYFRGNELRTGVVVYLESEAKTFNFTFQQNIIQDELEYRRKDDIVLSILASNKIEEQTGKTTKSGLPKTKCTRLEVLCTIQNGSSTPTYFVKKKDEDYPPNTGGERMTLQYPGAKNLAELKALASAELKKYYYTGFKGKFTTFGIPFCKSGDNVRISDPILPERNGVYKVKSVEYSAGMDGIRQTIQLDYKIV